MFPRPAVRLCRAIVHRAKVRRAAEEEIGRIVVHHGGESGRHRGGRRLPVQDVARRVGEAALAVRAAVIRTAAPPEPTRVGVGPARAAEAVILLAVVRERRGGRLVRRRSRDAVTGRDPVIAGGSAVAEFAVPARRRRFIGARARATHRHLVEGDTAEVVIGWLRLWAKKKSPGKDVVRVLFLE